MSAIAYRAVRSHIGYTVVELLIVTAVIVAMVTLFPVLLDSTTRYTRMSSRDSERVADTNAMMRVFEAYYRKNIMLIGPTYPSTDKLTPTNLPTLVENEAIRTPPATIGTGALTAAADTASPKPTTNQYIYQPFDSDGNLCINSTTRCVRYRIAYRTERDRSVVFVESEHQQ